MCGRVCSLSRVKGGVERCGVCHAGWLVCAAGAALSVRLLVCCGWGLIPPPLFFVAAGVHLWTAGKRKVAAWGECLVSSFA